MLIGLLSDTHIPEAAEALPAQLKEVFRGVDLILHAGDIYTTSVLDELEHIAPVLAARGDDDCTAEIISDRRVKEKHTLTAEGVTIWLQHIRPPYSFLHSKLYLETNPTSHKDEKLPNVIVFGHTHRPALENEGGILLVNPGSPTFPAYRQELGTVALLTINSGKAEAHIVQLE